MKETETIIILGASENPLRPSYMANQLLKNKGYNTLVIDDMNMSYLSQKKGQTVSIFLKPNQQKKYYEYILSIQPSRIIFNPGSENEEFGNLAAKKNIQVLSGCTIALIMNSML